MDSDAQKLNRMLAVEELFIDGVRNSKAAKRLAGIHDELLAHVREISSRGNLSLIIATERAIVESDLSRYANSQSMTSSLRTAINEIAVIERHIEIVDNQTQYKIVDQAHSLPKNRKGGLPFDEARQALASHHARLNNMDKSRLGDDEKRIIDARKLAIGVAGKLYIERQARTLGVNLAKA